MTENLINILFPNVQVTLEKGFSMMDWIRLTKSGKDLTGVGGCRVNGKVREVLCRNFFASGIVLYISGDKGRIEKAPEKE